MAMVFPTSPIVGQVFTSGSRSWVWNGSAWDSPSSISPTIISGLQQVLYYTSSGTFTKATYPWLRAIRVKCQAGGGGGAGANTTSAGQFNGGRSGSGGAYAESFITSITGLASSVTVTVGAGGAGGAAASSGGTGGTSSFGSLVSANGGQAGFLDGQGNMPGISPGISGATAFTGDFGVSGGASSTGVFTTGFSNVGMGGASFLGKANRNIDFFSTGGRNGTAGSLYGGGGTGGYNAGANAVTRTGGAGAAGIVIVELYA